MASNRVQTSSRMGANFEPTKATEESAEQPPAEDAKPAKKTKAEKPAASDAK